MLLLPLLLSPLLLLPCCCACVVASAVPLLLLLPLLLLPLVHQLPPLLLLLRWCGCAGSAGGVGCAGGASDAGSGVLSVLEVLEWYCLHYWFCCNFAGGRCGFGPSHNTSHHLQELGYGCLVVSLPWDGSNLMHAAAVSAAGTSAAAPFLLPLLHL